jgi:hypothetical protein
VAEQENDKLKNTFSEGKLKNTFSDDKLKNTFSEDKLKNTFSEDKLKNTFSEDPSLNNLERTAKKDQDYIFKKPDYYNNYNNDNEKTAIKKQEPG